MKLDELVDKYYSDLNLNDLYIWRYILGHKKACENMSISELAEHCNVSKTSILRFTQKISLNGFSELKFYLKMENNNEETINQDLIKTICNDYCNAIQYAENQNYQKACQMIYSANHVFAYGTGGVQQLAIQSLKRFFFKLNKSINIVYGSNEMDYLVNNLTSDDLVIVFSVQASQQSDVEFVQKCKDKNAKIISLTLLQDKPIARISDETLYYLSSHRDFSIHGRHFSPTSMFFITVEILFLQYAIYLESIQ